MVPWWAWNSVATRFPQIPSHLHEILHRNIENTGIGLFSIASWSSDGLAKNLYENAPFRAHLRQLVRSPDMKGILNYKLLVTGGLENLGMNNSWNLLWTMTTKTQDSYQGRHLSIHPSVAWIYLSIYLAKLSYFTNLDFPSSATFGVRSCEVAIIWPDFSFYILNFQSNMKIPSSQVWKDDTWELLGGFNPNK